MLGLPSAVAGPVLGGGLGSNFAFGGATTGPLNNVGFVPSLLTQTANFVTARGRHPRRPTPSTWWLAEATTPVRR